MGWCHEFGVEIETRCSHPMEAGDSACSCSACGTVCRGRFEGGCESVWERGLRPNAPPRPATYLAEPALALAGANRMTAVSGGVGMEIELDGAREDETSDGGAPGRERAEGDVEPSADGPPPRPGADDLELDWRLRQVEVALTALTGRVDRLAQVEGALSSLADQVAKQYQSQVTLQGHVTDLGKVLGELGVEVDDRLSLVESVLDGYGASDHREEQSDDETQDAVTDSPQGDGTGGARSIPPSVRPPAPQNGIARLPQDEDVEGRRPVVDVVEVQANGLLPCQVRPAAHLPQTGESRFDQ